jgi:putative ABC transport system substrate-binding protein
VKRKGREARGNGRRVKVSGFALYFLVLTLCSIADAQQPRSKTSRVGVLMSGSRTALWGEAFRNALRDLGYIEGHNIIIEYRHAEGKRERLIQAGKELVALKPAVLVAGGGNDATDALLRATTSIPIVMTAGSNAAARGLVSNLARPGGNVTGITSNWDDLSGKRLELLKETIPDVSLIAVLWSSGGGRQTQWKASQAVAKQLNLQIHSMQIRSADDLENGFKEALKAGSRAVAVTQNSIIGANIDRVIRLTRTHRLPAIFAIPEYAEFGGLMAYGGSRTDLARRAAIYVDKILKGANPAELPVEQPTKFELVINLKTVKQIGLAIPANVLARADRVIR